MKDQIEQRIRQLAHELRELEIAHLRLVQNKTREDQAFQQQAVQNQSRFAQIQGALTELKQLKQQGEYHAVSILDSIIHGSNPPDSVEFGESPRMSENQLNETNQERT